MKNLFLLSIVLACAGLANADERPALHVLAEKADPEATQCGLTQEGLVTAASRTLLDKGIRPSESRTNPYLYIAHSTILGAQRTECLVSLLVSVRATNLERPSGYGAFDTRRAYGSSVLCDSGGLLTSRASTMGERVTSALEEHVKACVAQLAY